MLQGEHPAAARSGRRRRRRGRGCRCSSSSAESGRSLCQDEKSSRSSVRRSSSLTTPAPVGGAVDGAVVHADQVAVAGHPHVALEGVGAGGDGLLVGGEGVLGDRRTTRHGARPASAGRRGRSAGRGRVRSHGVHGAERADGRRGDDVRSRDASDDRRRDRSVGLHRAAGGLPGEHAAREVHRVVALLAQPRRDLRRAAADLADDDDRASGVSGPGSWASRCGTCSSGCARRRRCARPPTPRPRGRRAARRRSGISSTRTVGTAGGDARLEPNERSLDQPGQPAVGQLAALGLAGRAVLEAAVGEGRPRARCRRRPGRAGRCGRAPAGRCASRTSGWRPSARPSARRRRSAPSPIASCSRVSSSSVSLAAFLNGDSRAACRISSE